MLSEIDEKRLIPSHNVKVRCHPGATIIDDMFDHLKPYLKKEPDQIILHVSTNDASSKKTSDTIFRNLLDLKAFIKTKAPKTNVTFSCPIVRHDNGLANLKIIHLRNKLKTSNENVILNENIDYNSLGRKGLHMTPRGDTRLAMNFINFLKRL